MLTRRDFVRLAGAGAALIVGGCSSQEAEPTEDPAAGSSTGVVQDTTTEKGSDDVQGSAETTTEAGASNALVVYYSRADENYGGGGERVDLEIGYTKIMAGYIADAIGADEYEIVPAEAYPADYDECCDVAMDEQTADARPEIANPLPDVSPYDTIFLGCPIWWGYEPMIIRTFLDGVDLSGKRVVVFTTHGGSGFGSVPENVQSFEPDAQVEAGKAVAGTSVEASYAEIVAWAESV